MQGDREKKEVLQKLKSVFAHPEYVDSVWEHVDVCDECQVEIGDRNIKDDFQQCEQVVNRCLKRISDCEADQIFRSKSVFNLFINFIREIWSEK